MRNVLVDALISCAEGPLQTKTRRFLKGLSCDELQFLADFLGASILEHSENAGCSRAALSARLAEFQRVRQASNAHRSDDQDHKMILLLEFLCRTGLFQVPVAARASHA